MSSVAISRYCSRKSLFERTLNKVALSSAYVNEENLNFIEYDPNNRIVYNKLITKNEQNLIA